MQDRVQQICDMHIIIIICTQYYIIASHGEFISIHFIGLARLSFLYIQ